MKFIKLITFALVILLTQSCEKCDKVLVSPCDDVIPNSEYCGWAVATCYGEDGAADVGVIYNTSQNSSAPIGDDWGATIQTIHPTNWNYRDIGQIFGIAIDDDENIYLGSSDIYFYDGFGIPASSNVNRPFPCGQIFKCAPPTWDAIPFVTLPSGCESYLGVGNIAYDKSNNQLFASNLDDGKIYRIDIASASILESFDPWQPDSGAAGIDKEQELVWGLAVSKESNPVKIYFTKPNVSPTTTVELYSVSLSNGSFDGSESLENLNVDLQTSNQITKVTDISISDDGTKMLVAQRGGPHSSTVIKLESDGNSWNVDQTKYYIGGFSGENVAGGVDFGYKSSNESQSEICNEHFWISSNYMFARNSTLDRLYGITMTSLAGNNSVDSNPPSANQDTDLFIDFDGLDGTGPKGHLGDVEIIDCSECGDPCKLNDLIVN